MPSSAWAARRAPSKANGLVTAATVSAPMSRASLATTGAAPVPVPPPEPGGQEDHVGALEQLLDLVLLVEGRLVADPRIRSGTEAAGHLAADVERHIRVRGLQRLKVGVDREELDARQLRLDHPVDGVDAGAADAHHPQDGLVGARHDGLAGRRAGRIGLVAAVAGRISSAGTAHEALQALVVDLDSRHLAGDGLGRRRLGNGLRPGIGSGTGSGVGSGTGSGVGSGTGSGLGVS